MSKSSGNESSCISYWVWNFLWVSNFVSFVRMKNPFNTALEIVIGLKTLQSNFNRYSSILIVDEIKGINQSVLTGLDFMMKVDPKTVLSIEKFENFIQLTVDSKRVSDFFDDYFFAYGTSIFDGKATEKRIDCIDLNMANMYIRFIDALCHFGFYSGYSFNHTTKELIAFI
ncbi:MAG TPA: hypothetical protein VFM18_24645 [Methanosarcina sp.]|nr:hypothetical protein [Methanosarcina sp.]